MRREAEVRASLPSACKPSSFNCMEKLPQVFIHVLVFCFRQSPAFEERLIQTDHED